MRASVGKLIGFLTLETKTPIGREHQLNAKFFPAVFAGRVF
jgi:hypothetical protein